MTKDEISQPFAWAKQWENKSGKHKQIVFEKTDGYTPLYPHPAPQPAQGEVVVTKNEAGQIVMVSRQDSEGNILSVIAESENT